MKRGLFEKLGAGVYVYARLENERQVLEKLKGLAEGEVHSRVWEALKQGSEIVAGEARLRAPVGTRPPRRGVPTGRLKRSTITKEEKKKDRIEVKADYPEKAGRRVRKTRKQAAGSKEYYAFAIEYGTHKMSAQPFLHPALEAKSGRVMEIVADELNKLCEEASRELGV